MYVLNQFVKMIIGNNGILLYNRLNNAVLDLNEEQGIELKRILENVNIKVNKTNLLDIFVFNYLNF